MSDALSTPAAQPGFSTARVTPNASHAFGGIWRLTARRFTSPGRWLMLVGMMALLVIFSIPAAPTRQAAEHGLIPWAILFYICFVVPMLAFNSAGGAMRDDLLPGTVDYVFTRPIRRPLYLVFRYLAQMACAQIDFLLALGVVIGIGVYHQVPTLWSAVPWLLFAQVLVVMAFSAFGLLCGLLTSRYLIVGILYGALIEFGLGQAPTQLSRFSLIRQVISMLSSALGDADNGLAAAAATSSFETSGTVILLLVYSAVMVAVTAALFSVKELAGAGGRDS